MLKIYSVVRFHLPVWPATVDYFSSNTINMRIVEESSGSTLIFI